MRIIIIIKVVVVVVLLLLYKRLRSFMSRTVITLKFRLRWFPEEAGYSAEKGYTVINLPPVMSNEDKNIIGSWI